MAMNEKAIEIALFIVAVTSFALAVAAILWLLFS